MVHVLFRVLHEYWSHVLDQLRCGIYLKRLALLERQIVDGLNVGGTADELRANLANHDEIAVGHKVVAEAALDILDTASNLRNLFAPVDEVECMCKHEQNLGLVDFINYAVRRCVLDSQDEFVADRFAKCHTAT